MDQKITPSESYTISVIRIIATLLIVTCHILQGYENRWAWVLNVGVQIFFFISVFLYGKKDIQNSIVWWKGRIRKVYLPYLCYLILCLPWFWIFASEFISIKKFLVYLFCFQGVISSAGIQGLGHLWFVSIIMVCYLITPVLQYFIRKYRLLFVVALIGVYLVYVSYFTFALSYITWLMVYCFAYGIAALYKDMPEFLIFLLGGAFVRLLYFSSWDDILRDTLFGVGLHALGGCLLFLFLYFLFSTTSWGIKKKDYFLWLDKYSFEIYLTHHIFILGPFSLLGSGDYPIFHVGLIVVLTLLSAFLLKWFVDKILLLVH